ncbi:hypothetical protein ONZ45_g13597 [Pleurotus djamor]|nr:hypothetical protein ONZ45_g13597 [Pleurotus djamor]
MSDSAIKITKLNNSNYREWEGEMKAFLMSKGLWRLVSGQEAKSAESDKDKLEKWELRAEKAYGDMFLAMEPDQRVHIREVQSSDPVAVWAALEKVHLSKKAGARFNAYDDLFNIRKEEGESLMVLGTRIEQAMANIQNLRPKDFSVEKLDGELQCMALIRALTDEYKHLSSALLLVEELDKDTILQAFRSEELNRQRTEAANRVAAGGSRGRNRGRGGFRGRGRPYGNGTSLQRNQCASCKKFGHWANECPENRAFEGGNTPFSGNNSGPSGNHAKQAAEEQADFVTEFAGQTQGPLLI